MTWLWDASDRIAADHPNQLSAIQKVDATLHSSPSGEPRSPQDRFDLALLSETTGISQPLLERVLGWYVERGVIQSLDALRCECDFRSPLSDLEADDDATCEGCGRQLSDAEPIRYWRLASAPG